MATINAFLHRWEDINPEQHRARVSFDRLEGGWSNEPRVLTVPDGWEVLPSQMGRNELYDAEGRHVTLVGVAAHGKSVGWASSFGIGHLSLAETEGDVVCSCCGQPI